MKKGFTLIELLLAISITGIIAALAIPTLVGNINQRILTTKLKNFVHDINFIATEQLTQNSTKNLLYTDFATPTEFFKHLDTLKTCTADYSDCWANTSYVDLNNKAIVPTHVFLANVKLDNSLNKKSKAATASLSTTPAIDLDSSKDNLTTEITSKVFYVNTAKLKNGLALSYITSTTTNTNDDEILGTFQVDVNGDDGPNIAGRDFFTFSITKKGKITAKTDLDENTSPDERCEAASANCLDKIIADGWVMKY